MLENILNQTTKFRRKNWVEINDDTRQTYNISSQTKFKTSMLKPRFCDDSDAYILVKGTKSIERVQAQAAPDNDGKEVVFKNCASFNKHR